MTTATLITAATLVMFCNSDLVSLNLKSRSTPVTEAERIEAVSSTEDGKRQTVVRITRKIGSLRVPNCFSENGVRRGHKRVQSEALPEKPRYVHTPQHAADSFMRTTSPIPFHMRPLAEDVNITPVMTNAQKAEEMREKARDQAAKGGRVLVVGSSVEAQEA